MCYWLYCCTYADVATKVTVNQTRASNILVELKPFQTYCPEMDTAFSFPITSRYSAIHRYIINAVTISLLNCVFLVAEQPYLCLGRLVVEESTSHSDTPTFGMTPLDEGSVRHIDLQTDTKLTRDKYPCPRRDSKPQTWQASGRRPMPQTAQPPAATLLLDNSREYRLQNGGTLRCPRCAEFSIRLAFWHRNFILHTLYIKCKNTGPKKGKIIK
jgi:hypothetical protein